MRSSQRWSERLRAAGCVFAEDEAALLVAAAGRRPSSTAMVDRRVAGEPLEHVLGWAEFCGLRIAVDAGVFVPRRRTELLVDARPRARTAGRRSSSTCAADRRGRRRAGAPAVTGLELYAADIDPAAVRVRPPQPRRPAAGATRATSFDAAARALRGRVDLLVANAPYVPTDAIALMPPEARDHEPRVALDGGADGLDVQRRVAAAAPRWLAPGGHLLIETSERQAGQTEAAIARSGLAPRVATSRSWRPPSSSGPDHIVDQGIGARSQGVRRVCAGTYFLDQRVECLQQDRREGRWRTSLSGGPCRGTRARCR